MLIGTKNEAINSSWERECNYFASSFFSLHINFCSEIIWLVFRFVKESKPRKIACSGAMVLPFHISVSFHNLFSLKIIWCFYRSDNGGGTELLHFISFCSVRFFFSVNTLWWISRFHNIVFLGRMELFIFISFDICWAWKLVFWW